MFLIPKEILFPLLILCGGLFLFENLEQLDEFPRNQILEILN